MIHIEKKQKIEEVEDNSGNNEQISPVESSFQRENIKGEYLMKPIGHIKSWYQEKNATPRQPSICSLSRATLTVDKTFFTNPQHSLLGLESFSHVWLIFVFHKSDSKYKAKVKPPRLNGKSVGLFSTRSPHRPNSLGLSLVKLEKIEDSTLILTGVDLLNGTPVLDIKPYIPSYDNPSNSTIAESGENEPSSELPPNISTPEPDLNQAVKVPDWIQSEKTKILVLFSNRAEKQLLQFHSRHPEPCSYCLEYLKDVLEARKAIHQILEEDPRSTYRRNKCTDRLYYFTVDTVHISCWFDENIAEIVKVKPLEK